jgi:putative DNA primase/helicase
LAREASEILAWLVWGTLAYQREGLDPPESVKLATESYHAEEDTLGQFIEERCQVGKAHEVRAGLLYQAYRDWSEESGLRPMSSTAFGRRMSKRYEKKYGARNVYLGLGLRAE